MYLYRHSTLESETTNRESNIMCISLARCSFNPPSQRPEHLISSPLHTAHLIMQFSARTDHPTIAHALNFPLSNDTRRPYGAGGGGQHPYGSVRDCRHCTFDIYLIDSHEIVLSEALRMIKPTEAMTTRYGTSSSGDIQGKTNSACLGSVQRQWQWQFLAHAYTRLAHRVRQMTPKVTFDDIVGIIVGVRVGLSSNK